MRHTSMIAPLACAAALLVAPAGTRAALVPTHVPSDADLESVLPDSKKAFVAEGRIGDRGGSATFELDLGTNSAAPAVTRDYDWQNGMRESFTLVYNVERNLVLFACGTQTMSFAPEKGRPMTDIFVRVRADEAGSSARIDEIMIDGEGFSEPSSAAGANGVDILWIRGANLADGFLMTGVAKLAWGSAAPSQSKLAFQIKVGQAQNTNATNVTTWGRIKAEHGKRN